MRKTMSLIIVCIAATLCITTTVIAHHDTCEWIKDGNIINSDGEVIETGFDLWGYNYQNHMFVGGFCEAYKDADWCQEDADVILYMKWNDAWLSNKDCDGDGALDRHYDYDSYIGSGAKLINFQKGYYLDDDGKLQRWTYYTKIIAAPWHAFLDDGVWYNKRGRVLGKAIWNDFYIKKLIYKDSGETPVPTAQNSLRSMTTQAKKVPYLDPFNVDFEQFTPMD